jgi:hypothetical protein
MVLDEGPLQALAMNMFYHPQQLSIGLAAARSEEQRAKS